MTIFDNLVYGAIQGVAEFLPISSSAHLALLPHFLKIEDPGVVFDLMMHLGTALAVIVYYRYELINNFKFLLPSIINYKVNDEKFFLNRHILLSTGVTVVMAVLLKKFGESYGRQPWMISINLILFGFFMWIADRKEDKDEVILINKNDYKKSMIIGFFQGLAISPGVSRSGATIGVARYLGLGRKEASSYSFLLSLPIILLGALSHVPLLLKGDVKFELIDCLIGIVSSFCFGIITIYFFVKLISKIGLAPFLVYRLILAGLLIYHFYLS